MQTENKITAKGYITALNFLVQKIDEAQVCFERLNILEPGSQKTKVAQALLEHNQKFYQDLLKRYRNSLEEL
jgi:hypothetical protein